MSATEVQRALVRIGHEIVEKHGSTEALALVGIERRGPELADRIAAAIRDRYGQTLPVMALDVEPYRDDREGPLDLDAAGAIPAPRERPFNPTRTTIVLVDDVLFTGRTARAALDALVDLGRPTAVRLAVLLDRGHRELPIRADHVGKNVPSARDEHIEVRLVETDGDDSVRLISPDTR